MDETNEHSIQSISNIMEEDKMDIEEATVNLSCVKKELENLKFVENQYRISLTYENIFGNSLEEKLENIDSLIGFLDDDVIMEMEMGTIKLEDAEGEDHIRKIIEQYCCSECGGNYEGYCPNCSSLSHILNNVTPHINPESDLNTTPIDILEIREISMRKTVFALKTIPKGVTLGPFEDIAPIDSKNGFKWKIKDKKVANDQKGNWMKYIQCVTNPLSKNLDIFQFDELLYFETSTEIQEGEELLVCYCYAKEVLTSDNGEMSYICPTVKEKFPKIFACTHCCLGFRLEQCLVEHKRKCPQRDHGSSIEDFEIIQCRCCKVWLEKQEHIQAHKLHCVNNYNNEAVHTCTKQKPLVRFALPLTSSAKSVTKSITCAVKEATDVQGCKSRNITSSFI